jgi:PAS domain S-box-containing protein
MKNITREKPLADLEMRRVVASGEFSWEQWRIRGLFDEKRGALLGYHAVGIEITAFKRSEQELRLYKNNLEILIEERTTELRQVNSELHKEIFQREAVEKELILAKFAMDHAHDLIFLLHPDGEIQYMNQRAREVLRESGLESKSNIKDILIQSSRSGIGTLITEDLQDIVTNDRTVIKGAIPDPRGSQLQFEITINRIEERDDIFYCCIARDITDRRKAEKELSVYRTHLETILEERTRRLQDEIESRIQFENSLRDNEERFRVMVEYSAEAVIIYDVKLNRFIDANHRTEELFGYSIVDLLMISPARFFANVWGDETIMQDDISVSLSRSLGGEVVVEERAVWTHSGHVLLCEIRMIGLVSQDRELIRIGCIDITRRIREKNPRDDEKLNEPGDGT